MRHPSIPACAIVAIYSRLGQSRCWPSGIVCTVGFDYVRDRICSPVKLQYAIWDWPRPLHSTPLGVVVAVVYAAHALFVTRFHVHIAHELVMIVGYSFTFFVSNQALNGMQEVLRGPVVCDDGFSYERTAV